MLIEDARELLERPMRLLEQMRAGSLWEPDDREPSEVDTPEPLPMISIIIPAHNEEGYLGRTLDALARQNYPCFEVIVVANGCTDTTPMEAVGKCNRLVVISQKSLGVARNLGARLARGEILVFLDADTLLEPAALHSVAAEFRKGFAAGTLKGLPDTDCRRFRAVYTLKNLVHSLALHPGSSGVILCWKRHFIKAGGFDEGLEMRENSELMRRLLRYGRYKYISTAAAVTSMRRYVRQGCLRMLWLWSRVWLQSLFGDLHSRPYETVR